MIENYGYHVTTVDIDLLKAPDVVGNVLNLPFREDTFDVAVCFEVLEHLPYRYFKTAVEEMASAARNYRDFRLGKKHACGVVFVF